MSLFYLQGLKSIIFNDLASPGGTKKTFWRPAFMTGNDANSSRSKAKSPVSFETGLF